MLACEEDGSEGSLAGVLWLNPALTQAALLWDWVVCAVSMYLPANLSSKKAKDELEYIRACSKHCTGGYIYL